MNTLTQKLALALLLVATLTLGAGAFELTRIRAISTDRLDQQTAELRKIRQLLEREDKYREEQKAQAARRKAASARYHRSTYKPRAAQARSEDSE